MSFAFAWPDFSSDFYASAKSMLDSALNRGPKPKVIADDIYVEELNMGTVPPDLDILEIGDLSRDRFRGIFRLTYAGDAHIVLSTKIQANPLSSGTAPAGSAASSASFMDGNHNDTFAPFGPSSISSAEASIASSSHTRGILFAATPLIVPMRLTLSHVRLRAIIVLVVSKTKGITLVFKNDPLESVQVSSTFDSVAVLAKYLQQEIEGQLKEVFREDLPGIIHRLSQKWLSSRNSANKSKATTGSSAPNEPKAGNSSSTGRPTSRMSATKKVASAAAGQSSSGARRSRKKSISNSVVMEISTQGQSSARRKPKDLSVVSPTSSPLPVDHGKATRDISEASSDLSDSSQDIPPPLSEYYNNDLGLASGIESYDPTYGLRPDEVTIPKDGKGFRGLKTLRKSMESTRPGKSQHHASKNRRDSGRRPTAVGLSGLLEIYSDFEEATVPVRVRAQPANLVQHSKNEYNVKTQDRPHSPPSRSLEEEGSSADEERIASSENECDYAPNIPYTAKLPSKPSSRVPDNTAAKFSHEAKKNVLDDYTRFGYPPLDAAFSVDAFELNSLASRSIFDEEDTVKKANSTRQRSPRKTGFDAESKHSKAFLEAGSSAQDSEASGLAPSVSARNAHGISIRQIRKRIAGPTRTRPRMFHSSSLLRIADPFGVPRFRYSSLSGAASPEHNGAAYASSSYFAGSGLGAGGASLPGSTWGRRSTGSAGNATIRGATRSSAGLDDFASASNRGGGSTFGKGRMFRIRSKEERERDRRHEMHNYKPFESSAPDPFPNCSAGCDAVDVLEGEDVGDVQQDYGSDESEDDNDNDDDHDDDENPGEYYRSAPDDEQSGSVSNSGSHSRPSKSSFSATRTLVTLEPEPVDSSLYDNQTGRAQGEETSTRKFGHPGSRQLTAGRSKVRTRGLGSRVLYRIDYGEDDERRSEKAWRDDDLTQSLGPLSKHTVEAFQ